MKLALTYDDGPNHPFTEQLLVVLAKHDVKATFFMVGKFVQERPDVAQEVASAGHWIGNHTFSHPDLRTLSIEEVGNEIDACRRFLYDFIGPHSNMFRPPFIRSSPAIEDVVAARRLKTILFKAAGGDAIQSGPDSIVNKVHKELNGESGIILLHDGCHLEMGVSRADTIEATDRLITRYQQEGCEFVSPLEVF